MCGIAGEIRFDETPADVAAVTTMTAALHRRGPDGWGIHAGGRTALGHATPSGRPSARPRPTAG